MEQTIFSIYKNLIKEDDYHKVVDYLGDIGELLLHSIITLKRDNKELILKPYWVEAYYRDYRHFVDVYAHDNDVLQKGDKNKPIHLYLHHRNPNCKIIGIDLAIGDDEHILLSYLLKVCVVNNNDTYLLQSDVAKQIFDFFEIDNYKDFKDKDYEINIKKDNREVYPHRYLRVLSNKAIKKDKEGLYYSAPLAIFNMTNSLFKEGLSPKTIYYRYK